TRSLVVPRALRATSRDGEVASGPRGSRRAGSKRRRAMTSLGEEGMKSSRLVSLIAGTILATAIVSVLARERTRFDELALGRATTSIFARVGDVPVHAQTREESDEMLALAAERHLS